MLSKFYIKLINYEQNLAGGNIALVTCNVFNVKPGNVTVAPPLVKFCTSITGKEGRKKNLMGSGIRLLGIQVSKVSNSVVETRLLRQKLKSVHFS